MKGIQSGKGKDEYRYSQPPSAGHGPWYCAHRKIWRLLLCFSYLTLFLILFVYGCRDGMAWSSKPHPQSCFKATPRSATPQNEPNAPWTPPTCHWWEQSVSGMAGTFLCVCMVFHGLWLNCWVCAQAEKIYVNLCLSFLRTVPSQDWDLESLEAASAREAAQALQYAVRLNDERRAQWKAWFSIVATWHQCCVVVGDCG